MALTTDDGLGRLGEAYLDALLSRDSTAARRVAAEALADGVAPGELLLDVFAPALHEVGHLWAMGEVSVAEEHYATAVTSQLVSAAAARMRRPPSGGRLAIVTTSVGELHALGAEVVSAFLEADGWEVLLLGASTPPSDLAALADAEAPDLVALSTTSASALPGLEATLTALGLLDPRPLVVVGGQFWGPSTLETAAEMGADLVLQDPRLLVGTLRQRVPAREDER